MNLFLKKYTLVSSVVHLSIEDGLLSMNIREWPQKGEFYHRRLHREDEFLLHFALNVKSLCSPISKIHGIRWRKHKPVQSCVSATLIPSSLSDQPAEGKEEEGVAH